MLPTKAATLTENQILAIERQVLAKKLKRNYLAFGSSSQKNTHSQLHSRYNIQNKSCRKLPAICNPHNMSQAAEDLKAAVFSRILDERLDTELVFDEEDDIRPVAARVQDNQSSNNFDNDARKEVRQPPPLIIPDGRGRIVPKSFVPFSQLTETDSGFKGIEEAYDLGSRYGMLNTISSQLKNNKSQSNFYFNFMSERSHSTIDDLSRRYSQSKKKTSSNYKSTTIKTDEDAHKRVKKASNKLVKTAIKELEQYASQQFSTRRKEFIIFRRSLQRKSKEDIVNKWLQMKDNKKMGVDDSSKNKERRKLVDLKLKEPEIRNDPLFTKKKNIAFFHGKVNFRHSDDWIAPDSREGATMNLITRNGNPFVLCIFGGCGNAVSSKFCRFVIQENIWDIKHLALSQKILVPVRLYNHTSNLYKTTQLILFGGRRMEGTALSPQILNNRTYSIDASDMQIRQLAISSIQAPTPRRNHSAAIIGDCLVVHGGVTEDDNAEYLNDIWDLDLTKLKWKKRVIDSYLSEELIQYGLAFHTSEYIPEQKNYGSLAGSIFTFGGLYAPGQFSTMVYRAKLESESMIRITKVEETGKPPVPRYHHAMSLLHKRKKYIYFIQMKGLLYMEEYLKRDSFFVICMSLCV